MYSSSLSLPVSQRPDELHSIVVYLYHLYVRSNFNFNVYFWTLNVLHFIPRLQAFSHSNRDSLKYIKEKV